MRWQKSDIKIASGPSNGPTMKGQIYGPFGMYGCRYGWTVVHLRTGLNVCSGVDKDKAKELILTLVELGDWNFGAFGDSQSQFSGPIVEATRQAVLRAKEYSESE